MVFNKVQLLCVALLTSTTWAVDFGTFSANVKEYIVEAHNVKRNSSIPTAASNMRRMEWNEDLAKKAADWASQCIFEHRTEGYGQNLFGAGGDSNSADPAIVNQAMTAWVEDELDESVKAAVRRDGGVGTYNHASQVLWAETYQVGCGYAACSDYFYVFCNYLPAGNYMGQPWFKLGNACSACPSDAASCSGNLCSNSVQPTMTPTPSTDAPYTPAPRTDAPYTPAPRTDAPYTPAPRTDAPYTPAPSTDEPHTPAPTSDAPYTPAPSSSKPTPAPKPTKSPRTRKPCTRQPRTRRPRSRRPCPRKSQGAVGFVNGNENNAIDNRNEADYANDDRDDAEYTPTEPNEGDEFNGPY